MSIASEYLTIAIIIAAINSEMADARSAEYSLHEKLFNGYDKNIRPVANVKDVITVKIQPLIYSLIQVDERIGSIEFIQWLQITWRDAYLRWNQSEFENIGNTHIPASKIWMPDIAVRNQMDDIKYPLAREDTLAKVFYDGTVIVGFLQTLLIRCHRFNLAQFPFDEQVCYTLYSSWTYNNDELILTIGKVIEEDQQFKHHSEWKIISFLPRSDNVSFTSIVLLQEENGSETLLNYTKFFGEIRFDLKLQRKPFYYVFTLVIPSIITTTICLIGLFNPFDTSGKREEKVTLGLTTMLAMTMILMLVANDMPRGGSSQLLGNYILFEIVLCTIATVTTVVIMCWHQRLELEASKPPKRLFRFIRLVLCVRERFDQREIKEQKYEAYKAKKMHQFDNNNVTEISTLNENKALQQLYKITENIQRNLKRRAIKTDWIHFFRFVDYFCMIFYNIVNLIVTLIVFC